MKPQIRYQEWGVPYEGIDYNITNIFFLDNRMVALTYQKGNTVRTIELSVGALESLDVFNFQNLLTYIDGK